uniref:Uncharacterized protein n=1 Tax=Anguilla anguilla TaxID=7936 RepID=A0A0E9X1C3_ANGAN
MSPEHWVAGAGAQKCHLPKSLEASRNTDNRPGSKMHTCHCRVLQKECCDGPGEQGRGDRHGFISETCTSC